jgi:hypothetical protein
MTSYGGGLERARVNVRIWFLNEVLLVVKLAKNNFKIFFYFLISNLILPFDPGELLSGGIMSIHVANL